MIIKTSVHIKYPVWTFGDSKCLFLALVAALSLLKLLKLSFCLQLCIYRTAFSSIYMANIPRTLQPAMHCFSQLVPDFITSRPHSASQIQSQISAFIQAQSCSLCAFSDLRAVHEQRVNDPVSSLPAAHSFHAAVVVSECKVRLRAVVHELTLQAQIAKAWTKKGSVLFQTKIMIHDIHLISQKTKMHRTTQATNQFLFKGNEQIKQQPGTHKQSSVNNLWFYNCT